MLRTSHKHQTLGNMKQVPYYSRNSRTFFNQNFVSKFRVRDLCEEMILRK